MNPDQKQQYQKFEDEAEDAKQQAQALAKQGQEVVTQGMAKGQEAAKQAQHYAEVGQKAYEENKEKVIKYERYAEQRYEEGADYVVKHSKILRVLAALFVFPIWLPFYQLLHTGLRSWDICVNVEQKLSSTFRKFMFFLFMLFMGCGITQTILAIFAFIHLFQNCKVLQESPSALNGMHSMVYEEKCSAADKIEETLLLIFGDFHITADQQRQIDDIEKKAENVKKQVDTVANMGKPSQSPGLNKQ